MSNRIVCIGDSITEGIGDSQGTGWPGRLNAMLAVTQPDQWHVINLGVAGDTSIDVYHRLCSEALYRQPSLLFIAAGLNDVVKRQWPTALAHKIDFNFAKDVWTRTLERLKREATKVIFVGLTPVNEAAMPLIYMPHDAEDQGHTCTNSDVQKYNQMLRGLVQSHGFIYLDIFDTLLSNNYIETVIDGLHPNSQGYDMLHAIIYEQAQSLRLF